MSVHLFSLFFLYRALSFICKDNYHHSLVPSMMTFVKRTQEDNLNIFHVHPCYLRRRDLDSLTEGKSVALREIRAWKCHQGSRNFRGWRFIERSNDKRKGHKFTTLFSNSHQWLLALSVKSVSVTHKDCCNVSTSRFSGRLTCFDNRISCQSSLKFSGYQEPFFAQIHFMPYWLRLESDRSQMHNLTVSITYSGISNFQPHRHVNRGMANCEELIKTVSQICSQMLTVIRWTSSLVSFSLFGENLSSSS